MALGRNADALQMLDYAHQNVQFRRKYDVWYAAASACCVAAYLRRGKRQPKRAELDLRRFIEEPAHGLQTHPQIWTAAFVRKHIAGERERFEQWFYDPNPKHAVEALTWWTATLIFFREMTFTGFPRKGKLNLKRLDSEIKDAMARIRDRLHRLER
jgi:hypothetical protein